MTDQTLVVHPDDEERLGTLLEGTGIRVLASPYVPITPPPWGLWIERYVRHGFADVLEWLGEKAGPLPDEPLHTCYLMPDPDKNEIEVTDVQPMAIETLWRDDRVEYDFMCAVSMRVTPHSLAYMTVIP